MSILQITSCQPSLYIRNTPQSQHVSSKCYLLPVRAKLPLRNPSLATCIASKRQLCTPILKNQTQQSVCLLGGKGKNGSDNEGSAWKALENAMGKESPIEDVLRQQIEKKEFYPDKYNATCGGGSGGRGGAGGSSGSEDRGFAGIIHEILQVILATIGFVFLYVCTINGEDWTYFKFLYSGSESARLKRAMQCFQRRSENSPVLRLSFGFYQPSETNALNNDNGDNIDMKIAGHDALNNDDCVNIAIGVAGYDDEDDDLE